MESRTGLWKWTCRADDLGGNIHKEKLAKHFTVSSHMYKNQVGQDCRVNPVVRGDTTHVRTCPGQVAISPYLTINVFFWQEIRTLIIKYIVIEDFTPTFNWS